MRIAQVGYFFSHHARACTEEISRRKLADVLWGNEVQLLIFRRKGCSRGVVQALLVFFAGRQLCLYPSGREAATIRAVPPGKCRGTFQTKVASACAVHHLRKLDTELEEAGQAPLALYCDVVVAFAADQSGSLRGDYCIRVGRNLIHGSDGGESAQHEIGMWFTEVRENESQGKPSEHVSHVQVSRPKKAREMRMPQVWRRVGGWMDGSVRVRRERSNERAKTKLSIPHSSRAKNGNRTGPGAVRISPGTETHKGII